MKIDRLFGILSIMLEKDRIKAKQLADHFEVSTRTIYRDIDSLNQAGIPVITYPGTDGGLGLMPQYKMDKNFFSKEELSIMLSSIDGMQPVIDRPTYQNLKTKLWSSTETYPDSPYMVDFGGWSYYKNTLDIIRQLKKAISEQKKIHIRYASSTDIIDRTVEPYRLIYKGNYWYLYGYCLLRKDFRLFKATRIASFALLEETFEKREIKELDLQFPNQEKKPDIQVKVSFDPAMTFLMMDMVGQDHIQLKQEKRYAIFEIRKEDLSGIISMILSLGEGAVVEEPEFVRQEIKKILQSMISSYER